MIIDQYTSIRRTLPAEAILLFRLGDFYEAFGADAKEMATLLNLTLTTRKNVPMTGVPYHALDRYTEKLIAAGKKVFVCERAKEGAQPVT